MVTWHLHGTYMVLTWHLHGVAKKKKEKFSYLYRPDLLVFSIHVSSVSPGVLKLCSYGVFFIFFFFEFLF
jgi:hypothetical protein